MNYIECINVDYKSTRKESFYGTSYFPKWVGFVDVGRCRRKKEFYVSCDCFSFSFF